MYISKVVFVAVLMMALVSMAAFAEGDCGGGGGQLKDLDTNANSYGIIDSHAFHTVRGVTVLNMVEGHENTALANTNVYFIDDNEEIIYGSLNTNNFEAEEDQESRNNEVKQFNRIAAHAFHDVKGVTMVQMISGDGNYVATNLNVNITAGFMENAYQLFHTEGHE